MLKTLQCFWERSDHAQLFSKLYIFVLQNLIQNACFPFEMTIACCLIYPYNRFYRAECKKVLDFLIFIKAIVNWADTIRIISRAVALPFSSNFRQPLTKHRTICLPIRTIYTPLSVTLHTMFIWFWGCSLGEFVTLRLELFYDKSNGQ